MTQEQSKKKPGLRLTGADGNVFNLIGLACKAGRAVGWTKEQVVAFQNKCCQSKDYDEVLRHIMEEFDVT